MVASGQPIAIDLETITCFSELHPQISINASYQKCSRYPHTKQYKRTNETRNESFRSTATSTTSKNGYSGEFLKCEIEILKIFHSLPV